MAALGLILAGTLPGQAASLDDLGFPQGFTLRGPFGGAEAFFPLPQRPGRTDLELNVTASPMLDDLSSVTVYAEDTPLGTLRVNQGTIRERLPIPPRFLTGEFLRLRFQGDQALRRGVECFDNDTPAVWTRIEPSTQLLAAEEGNPGLGVVWRQLSGNVGISLPANLSTGDLEAAIAVAMALTSRGARPVMLPPNDPGAHIRIGPASTLALEPRADGGQRIVVADGSAAAALIAMGQALRVFNSTAANGRPLQREPLHHDLISFIDLDIPPQAIDVYGSASLTFELPLSRLPAGRRPQAMLLRGKSATVPQGESLVVALYAGRRLVWSETYRGQVDLDGVRVNLPPDLVRHRMAVTLRLVRVGIRRNCTYSDALNMQLHGTSQLVLTDGPIPAGDFGGLAFPDTMPALVRLGTSQATAAAAVPLVARLLADSGARPESVEVSTSGALNRPFIAISETLPPDLAGAGLLRPDRNRVTIDMPRAGTRVELGNVGAVTVVQLASAGAIPGLWVSPGTPQSLVIPPRATLTTGTVAVYDGRGLPVTFDTRSPDVTVVESGPVSAPSLLQRWRTELFIAIWLLVTIAAIGVVIRIRRSRAG
ncbi:cellulose biosynthesis cyclic di-GMP-binding regulatory protein BcsB [Belnapia sp. T6]|uniref:Cyclic di-GMP-binding protein n=1 Tax=Belnapia mucosa TaxID=2804532 RepID=A0ABS1UZ61_9PROT|nr:cellulose biosynthesis cyclic di-GMP-binding regulatory protein BcsB [Belnapia mucosa]MBL6453724.1 cellulose biosynthesis cyclic di-GMP-binding regulatory protein BcsB [Belnapia mucosa]